jgi:hypothetical protein
MITNHNSHFKRRYGMICRFFRKTEEGAYVLDCSPAGVEKAIKVIKKDANAGKAIIYSGNVSSLYYDEQIFNLVAVAKGKERLVYSSFSYKGGSGKDL